MTGTLPAWHDEDLLQAAREAVAAARGVVVLTGAGVSAESGVPTFRDPVEGLWARYRPEELATPQAFARDPRLVWGWYDMRRKAVLRCAPNPAHEALARFLATRHDVTLVTQNVDGLHQRALAEACRSRGIESHERVLPLHGTLFQVKCSQCGRSRDHTAPVDTKSLETLPHCPSCGGLERPAVVWFGEMLPADILDRAFRSAGTAELCLVVGTSAAVHPAASVPRATLQAGGRIVEVNPEASALSSLATWRLTGPAGEVLPLLLGPGDD